MFSFREINKSSRTFGYLEEVATKEAKELLYFTDHQREDDTTEAEKESREEMAKYMNPSDGSLKNKFQFKILPNIDFKDGFERDTVYCCGGPGSGKTWQIANYIENYHRFYPDHKILYVSANRIENDKSLEKVVSLKRPVLDKNGDQLVDPLRSRNPF
jgi:chromosomal replication initiation ATPase DnaA